MCVKKQFKYCPSGIDPCMKELIDSLRRLGVQTLSCCCGHGEYKMSVVVDFGFSKVLPVEIFSGIELPRKKRFYRRDGKGYYYIPEVHKPNDKRKEVGKQ